MYRSRFLAAVAAAAILACTALPRASSAADPYQIDVILPLTGGGAFIGQTHQKTLTLLEGVLNKQGGIAGRPIEFVFHDDQTNPAVDVQLVGPILAKKPTVVIGSSLSALCHALEPLFANGPVMYCLSPAIYPPKGSYAFANTINTDDLLAATMQYFRDRGITRIARLATTDASGQDGSNAVTHALALPENKSIQLVASEQYGPTDVSVAAQVTNIKAAQPQAVICWVSGAAVATGLRGLHDAGMEVPVVTSSANMVDTQLKGYQSFIPKELLFPGVSFAGGLSRGRQVAAAQKLFVDTMKANNIDPTLQVGLPWDPALIVIEALKKLGPNATAAQLRDYIVGLHDFAGITGMYDFRAIPQRGIGRGDVVMIRWDGTKADPWSAVSKLGGALR
jgi:branched-chain amino acid transport system substrate-binding protein